MYAKLTLSAAFVALAFSHNALAADHNLSADILVVGAGSAGLTAAVQAAEKGKKVILLEKNLGVGGSSQFAEGLFESSEKRSSYQRRSFQNLNGKTRLCD